MTKKATQLILVLAITIGGFAGRVYAQKPGAANGAQH